VKFTGIVTTDESLLFTVNRLSTVPVAKRTLSPTMTLYDIRVASSR
jgi:hypothetical protein